MNEVELRVEVRVFLDVDEGHDNADDNGRFLLELLVLFLGHNFLGDPEQKELKLPEGAAGVAEDGPGVRRLLDLALVDVEQGLLRVEGLFLWRVRGQDLARHVGDGVDGEQLGRDLRVDQELDQRDRAPLLVLQHDLAPGQQHRFSTPIYLCSRSSPACRS